MNKENLYNLSRMGFGADDIPELERLSESVYAITLTYPNGVKNSIALERWSSSLDISEAWIYVLARLINHPDQTPERAAELAKLSLREQRHIQKAAGRGDWVSYLVKP